MKSNNFTPQIIDDKHVTFLFALYHCPNCGKPMVVRPNNDLDIFPFNIENDFNAQVQRGNFTVRSEVKIGGEYICVKCANGDLAVYECYLCKEKKPKSKLVQSFKHSTNASFLCIDCYETVPAKKWDKTINELKIKVRSYRWLYS